MDFSPKMSMSKQALKTVGSFLGVADDDQQKWREKAEQRIRNEEFGLHLTQSKVRHSREQDVFLTGAEKMLSKIELFQKMEENLKKQADDSDKVDTEEDEDKIDTEEQDETTGQKVDQEADHLHSGTHWTQNETYEENSDSDGDFPSKTVRFKDDKPDSANETNGDNLKSKQSEIVFFDENAKEQSSEPDADLTAILKSPVDENEKPNSEGINKDSTTEEETTFKEQDNSTSQDNEGCSEEATGFVYGKEALRHYQLFSIVEKKVLERKLEEELDEKLEEYNWKLMAIDEIIDLAKDYYTNPITKNVRQWRDLKRKVQKSSSHHFGRTEVRQKIGALPVYRPIFTWFIIAVQLCSFIVTCILAGFAKIGLVPSLSLQEDVQTFMGTETVHKFTEPNVWIGPNLNHLIGYGALYAPCIRNDINIQLEYSKQGYSKDVVLGCCELKARNVAGTTTNTECRELSHGVGVWNEGVPCGDRPVNEASVSHVIKPCCVGVKGQCRMLSHKHCMFYGGVFFQHGGEHCTQVNCLREFCKPGSITTSSDQPWLPDSPQQWWRLFVSLIHHPGVIPVAIVTIAEYLLFVQVSAIFEPYVPQVGGVGAVCGITGVIFIELLQFWSIVKQPWKELCKLLVMIAFLIFLGTLPYHNIFGMIVAFIVGMLCGIILLPYITFTELHIPTRLVLVLISVPLLLGLFILAVHLLTAVQTLENCNVCNLIECVPYMHGMCNKQEMF